MATVDTLRPNSTDALTGWEANPHLKLINNGAGSPPTSADTDALTVAGEYVATLVNGDTFTIGFGTFTLGTDVVSQVKVWYRWRGTLTGNLIAPTLGTIATVSIASGGTVNTSSATFTGSLTQTQIDGLQVQVNSTATQSPNARIGWIFIEVTHDVGGGGGSTVKQLAALGVG